MVVEEEVQAQNWRQQHYYQHELMPPVLQQIIWCLQFQGLLLVCKSKAVGTEQEITTLKLNVKEIFQEKE